MPRESVFTTTISFFAKVINWLKRYNWQFIAGTAVLLILFEGFEILQKGDSLTDPYHWSELLIYLAILLLVGILIEFLIKANITQDRAMEILKYKHDISLELTKINDWGALKDELVKLPGKIANVSATRLQIYNPIPNTLTDVASWNAGKTQDESFYHDCQQCVEKLSDTELPVMSVCGPDNAGKNEYPLEYCIQIKYGDSLLGLIQIKPKDDKKLPPEKIEIFESLVPEIALVLKVRQEQESLRELQNTQTALAERRTVSTFIHDQLGQNLGFLHLKLDQLLENENVQQIANVSVELKRLREVANESYEIVRDILKTIRTETTPNITNLMQEQSRSVSRRAKFKLDFQTMGKPMPLSPTVQQSVFFTFCEILSNVEKHAHASKVDVLVAWNDSILDISVKDNGDGFEPDNVQGNEHFGLQIIKERMTGIKGKIMIDSSANSGTVVSMSIPFRSMMVNHNE